jgi:DNA gyrase inhibitor GyrI
MKDLEPHIIRLEPFHVASALGYGLSPERESHEKLLSWAEGRGLLADRQSLRFFGFNNPGPSVGSPNYGYEFWMTVGPEVQPDGDIMVKDFEGGLYAMVRCQGAENIGPTWEKLVAWLETSPYTLGQHQWLEEHLAFQDVPDDQLLLDLYMPIV